jgi:hypothetical protein
MELDRPFRGSEAVARGEVSKGRLRGPGFVSLGRDVHVAVGVPLDHEARARAAMLRHAGAVVTGVAGAVLWGAGEAVTDVGCGDVPTEVLVTGATVRSRGGLDVGRAGLAADEIVEWPDPPGPALRLTSPARTILEVTRRLPTVDAVVVADALARRCGVSGSDVRALADRHGGERGVARARAVATLMDAGSDTPRRTRVRLGVLLARLPPPTVDLLVRAPGTGFVVGALDLGWPATRSGVLLDRHPEVAWMCGEGLVARGWEVVGLGGQGEHTVEHVVERIAALVARVDRLRWRDLPDLRGRFPRRPTAPRTFG